MNKVETLVNFITHLVILLALWYRVPVKEKKNNEQDVNFVGATTDDFVKYYNENIPKSYPRATMKILRKFQSLYPSLFKENGEWTINKHRKKLMDWLSSYRDDA